MADGAGGAELLANVVLLKCIVAAISQFPEVRFQHGADITYYRRQRPWKFLDDPRPKSLAPIKNGEHDAPSKVNGGFTMVRLSIEARGCLIDVSYQAAPEGLVAWIASINGWRISRTLDGVVFAESSPYEEGNAKALMAVMDGLNWSRGRLF